MNTTKQQFLVTIQQLTSLLEYPSPTIGMLIKEIYFASAHWQAGEPFPECEDFAYRRFRWRVQDDLSSRADPDRALRILATVIPLGIQLFSEIEGSSRAR